MYILGHIVVQKLLVSCHNLYTNAIHKGRDLVLLAFTLLGNVGWFWTFPALVYPLLYPCISIPTQSIKAYENRTRSGLSNEKVRRFWPSLANQFSFCLMTRERRKTFIQSVFTSLMKKKKSRTIWTGLFWNDYRNIFLHFYIRLWQINVKQ